MKIVLFILPLLLFSCQAEDLTKEQLKLKESSVVLKGLTDLSNKLYKKIAKYNIIMIGEMHGTNEPAEFAYGLCKLINKKEGKVIMAMEIHPSQMNDFNEKMTIDQLNNLNFFVGENSSGMNGVAWRNLISRCNQHDNITVKFFDHQSVSPRDSSMYNAILEIRKNHPNTKIVTLSGNLHNRLEPFNGHMMLGTYLKNDVENFEGDRIMSIMHYYNHGTMMNNTGNGLELRTIESKENIFNRTLSASMFFCKNIFEDVNYMTHILYTDKVTHSETISGR